MREVKKAEDTRKTEGATTFHPLPDLWVAFMTDGEPL